MAARENSTKKTTQAQVSVRTVFPWVHLESQLYFISKLFLNLISQKSGIAYILRLLNQYHEFDSLHWFQSVREKFLANKVKQNFFDSSKKNFAFKLNIFQLKGLDHNAAEIAAKRRQTNANPVVDNAALFNLFEGYSNRINYFY